MVELTIGLPSQPLLGKKLLIYVFVITANTHRNVVWQSIAYVQLSDLGLELFSVVRFLDADSGEIFRCHTRYCVHVITGGHKQRNVLLEVDVHQPSVQHVLVLLCQQTSVKLNVYVCYTYHLITIKDYSTLAWTVVATSVWDV